MGFHPIPQIHHETDITEEKHEFHKLRRKYKDLIVHFHRSSNESAGF